MVSVVALSRLTLKLEALQDQLSSSYSEKEQLEQRLLLLTQHRDKLEQENARCKACSRESQQKGAGEIADLKQQAHSLKQKLSEVQRALARSQSDREQAVSQRIEAHAKLQEDHLCLQQQLAHSQVECHQLQKQLSSQSSLAQAIEEELKAGQAGIKGLQNSLDKLQAEMERQETESQRHLKVEADLVGKMQEMQQHAEARHAEVNRLKHNLADAATSQALLEEKHHSSERERSKLAKEAGAASREAKEAVDSNQRLLTKLKSLQGCLDKNAQKQVQQHSTIEALAATCTRAEDKSKSLAGTISGQEAELQSLKDACQELETRLMQKRSAGTAAAECQTDTFKPETSHQGPPRSTGTAIEDIFQSLADSGGASDSDDSDSEQHVAAIADRKEPVRQSTGKSREKNLWDAGSSSSDDSAPALTGSTRNGRHSFSADASLTMCQCGQPDDGVMLQCQDCHKRWHQECCKFNGPDPHGFLCEDCTEAEELLASHPKAAKTSAPGKRKASKPPRATAQQRRKK
ncbi:hypothetical protein WJX73_010542 [Symbiochloris irregularis]|uniref:Zinc finger PHD-type domain-containing protein n=1 Tax=Symbiochloris irregularis TaxID=706552 RepID=A0AAW1NSF5_9CHLO